jgi:RluA family pseudouridine synthase
LFEDDDFVVVDKPAGLVVIPSPKREARTLVSEINRQMRQDPQHPRVWPCHRLDRETSGAMLMAKGKKNQQRMMALFRQHAVHKTYIAFVHGRMPRGHGVFQGRVRSVDQQKHKTAAPKKPARTEYRVIRTYPRFTQVAVNLVTGRTNQIRIHFADAGVPLVGERKYAVAKHYPLKFRRVALHAFALEWLHPRTKKNIIVQSPLHHDMEAFLTRNAKEYSQHKNDHCR